jgi:Kef-type K+ transport system membrane component KefB
MQTEAFTVQILFIIGLIIILGFAAGKVFQRLKIPRVLGFIIIGLILGSAGVIPPETVQSLSPIIDLALGFIGFTIGCELDLSKLFKGPKKLLIILLCEAIGTFLIVTVAFQLVFGELYISLIFGALASATAPAATVEVIREYCAKGELTQVILFILALDDIIAVVLFNFVIAYASPEVVWSVFILLAPLVEIGLAFVLGCSLGYILVKLEELFQDETEWLILTIASIILCTGMSQFFGISSILSNIALGITVENISSLEFKRFEEKLEVILLPLFIGFFVLTGAHLNLAILLEVGIFVAIYVVARSTGKIFGAFGGAKLARESPKVANNLGFSLLSQAGVALGLAYLASSHLAMLGNPTVGFLIFNVITASVLIMDLFGPLGVKFSLQRAKEVILDEELCEPEP